jgi:hypothetical protein
MWASTDFSVETHLSASDFFPQLVRVDLGDCSCAGTRVTIWREHCGEIGLAARALIEPVLAAGTLPRRTCLYSANLSNPHCFTFLNHFPP